MSKPSIYGPENLRRYIEKCNMPYFKIIVSDSEAAKKSALASNYDKDGQTVSDVRRDVDEYLDTIRYRGGDFILWLCSKPNSNLPEFRQWVEIPGENNHSGPGIGYAGAHVDIEQRIEQGIAAALEKYQTEQRIKALEAEKTELTRQLKENAPGALERIAGRLEPYLPSMISGLAKALTAPAAVSGTQTRQGQAPRPAASQQAVRPQPTATQQTTQNQYTDIAEPEAVTEENEEQAIAENALNRLYSDDPDFTAKLLKLADLKENNPEVYNMAITYLENSPSNE